MNNNLLSLKIGELTTIDLGYVPEKHNITFNHFFVKGQKRYLKNFIDTIKESINKVPLSSAELYVATSFFNHKDRVFTKIESEDNKRLDILKELKDIIDYRGEIFKKTASFNFNSYIENTGSDLSRIVLIIEYPNLDNSKDIQSISEQLKYIDIILRMGRTFGIHIFLVLEEYIDIDVSIYSNIDGKIELLDDGNGEISFRDSKIPKLTFLSNFDK